MTKTLDARDISNLFKEWESLIWLIKKATVVDGCGGLDLPLEFSQGGAAGLPVVMKSMIRNLLNDRAIGLLYTRREEIEQLFEANSIPIPSVRP